jgi:hypothetical protein
MMNDTSSDDARSMEARVTKAGEEAIGDRAKERHGGPPKPRK